MSLIRVERGGDGDRVAIVTLDAPERRNSLTLEMVREIVDAFDALDADESVGAVVVTGAPPAFCAGADLSHLGGSQEAGLRDIYEGFLRVGRSPLPTIAAVNGAAVGAGMNLALCCDIRVAGKRAKFDTRFLQLGLHPGGGHTWMLRRAVGDATAATLVLFGEVLDGDAAERCGLAWRSVDDDELLHQAIALASKAAAAPRALSMRAKQTLATMAGVRTHEEAIDVEIEAQLWSLQQPDFRERLAAMQQQISKRT
ncbi:MAG TPA: enoyl-CoA hydratase [Acidimicrobiales bacterium]|jgi:enoyl-CoA hydratase|nr:enoyl-CoA hydratase [Acidimicrobiales bacterium]